MGNYQKNDGLFVAVALPPPLHGQSLVNERVVNTLKNMCIKNLYICNISPREKSKNFKYHLNRIISVAISVFRLLSHSCRINAVYFVVESGYGVLYNYILLSLARLLSKEINIHHHTAFHTLRYNNCVNLLLLIAGKKTNHFVLCEGMKNDLLGRYRAVENVFIVNNAVFVNKLKKIDTDRCFKKTAGYISNISVEKGFLTAAKSFEYCLKFGSIEKLIVAGPVGDDECRLEIEILQKKYPNNFFYMGPVYGDNKEQFFNRIDFLLFPTKYQFEAQPLVVLEAMQKGIPVIATPIGYISELIGDAGYIIEDKDDVFCRNIFEISLKWVNNIDLYKKDCENSVSRYEKLLKDSGLEFQNLINIMKDGNRGVA